MSEPEYKSSVLRCYDDPCECLVCSFIAGDRSPESMLETIRVLDASLADKEILVRHLLFAAGDAR